MDSKLDGKLDSKDLISFKIDMKKEVKETFKIRPKPTKYDLHKLEKRLATFNSNKKEATKVAKSLHNALINKKNKKWSGL